jgi:hydroxymethylglutaryl-CoA lyase
VTECPYDGVVDPQQVRGVAAKLLDMGCYEISLCDMIGRASPPQIEALLTCLCGDIGAARLAGRYHDPGGQACSNVPVSLAHGMRVFDAAIGGLGGCTYALGVVGNIATEKLHRSLMDLGYDTGLMTGQIDKVAAMSRAMPGDEINV